MRLAFTLGLLLCLLSACEAPPPSPPAPSLSLDRPSDSLLARPDLQALVDAQVARDAAPLIAALGHEDPLVRARAAFALASVQAADARPALERALADPDPRVRADAAFALGQLFEEGDAAPLLARLEREPDDTVKAWLLDAIAKTGDRAALQTLTALDPPPALDAHRALAIGAFGRREIIDSTAVVQLLAGLRSSDEMRRQNAAYFFGRIRDTTAWAFTVDSLRQALRRLRSNDPAAIYLTTALGRLGRPRDLPLLTTRLNAALDWRIRVAAAQALSSYLAAPPAQQALIGALKDDRHLVALQAAGVLAGADSLGAQSRDALRDLLDEGALDWRIAAPLVAALLRDEPGLNPAPWFASWPSSPRSQAAAVGALANAHPDSARAALDVALADTNAIVVAAALGSLSTQWRRDTLATGEVLRAYYRRFTTALASRDIAAVFTVAPVLVDNRFRALGSLDSLRTVYRQLETPKDVEAMTAILDALGRAGDADLAGFLREQATHPNATIRRHASAAHARATGAVLPDEETTTEAAPPIDWAYLSTFGPYPVLTLQTERGTIRLRLDAEQAPQTTYTLLRFAEAGRYDGTPFHRVVPNFVIQGGDFARADGFGGPDFAIRSEFTRLPYRTGTVGMASAGKDTEGSQFFITHSMQPHLNGRYTAFGKVLSGQSVADRIRPWDCVEKVMIEK